MALGRAGCATWVPGFPETDIGDRPGALA
jgi:hypothetical protein